MGSEICFCKDRDQESESNVVSLNKINIYNINIV